MPEESESRSRGGHAHGASVSYAEALADNLARRAAEAALPGNVEYAATRRYRRKVDQAEEYGPPNPFAFRKAFRPRMTK